MRLLGFLVGWGWRVVEFSPLRSRRGRLRRLWC